MTDRDKLCPRNTDFSLLTRMGTWATVQKTMLGQIIIAGPSHWARKYLNNTVKPLYTLPFVADLLPRRTYSHTSYRQLLINGTLLREDTEITNHEGQNEVLSHVFDKYCDRNSLCHAVWMMPHATRVLLVINPANNRLLCKQALVQGPGPRGYFIVAGR